MTKTQFLLGGFYILSWIGTILMFLLLEEDSSSLWMILFIPLFSISHGLVLLVLVAFLLMNLYGILVYPLVKVWVNKKK